MVALGIWIFLAGADQHRKTRVNRLAKVFPAHFPADAGADPELLQGGQRPLWPDPDSGFGLHQLVELPEGATGQSDLMMLQAPGPSVSQSKNTQ